MPAVQGMGKGGVTVRAKVIRADGTEENLGIIASCPGAFGTKTLRRRLRLKWVAWRTK